MVHSPQTDCDGAGAVHQPRSIDEPAVFNCQDHDRIDVAIVEAISDISGTESCQLETRLYDVVDPDALRQIIRSSGSDIQVTFRFGAYRVSVFGDGEIRVSEANVDQS